MGVAPQVRLLRVEDEINRPCDRVTAEIELTV
jgi:hypothetical protein